MTDLRSGDDFAFADVVRISPWFESTGGVKTHQTPAAISRFRRSAKRSIPDFEPREGESFDDWSGPTHAAEVPGAGTSGVGLGPRKKMWRDRCRHREERGMGTYKTEDEPCEVSNMVSPKRRILVMFVGTEMCQHHNPKQT
jgi:hypothetical protein